MKLQRPCTQEEFNAFYQYQSVSSIAFPRNKCGTLRNIRSFFPILRWLPYYKMKSDLLWDLQAGFTVAILHIPQGMGYAALGGVNPIVGIYMAIFPILVYFLLGTSRHVSLGSFSIICLMVSKPVSDQSSFSPIEVATVVCLLVGVVQILMGICKVGSLTIFMSESLVSGFTTGAAVLVLISQLELVFGVKVKRHFGIFNAIYTLLEIVYVISDTNLLSLTMSVSVIVLLSVYTSCVQPRLKCKQLVPMELVVIAVGTLISYLCDLKNTYSINIVGPLPSGLPTPTVPLVQLMPDVLLDSVLIAVVSFSVHVSMASLFALKDNYTVDPCQELVALGLSNIFGGFFSCLPIGASLSRSVIQHSTGGRTQIASIFSSLFLLTVIIYFGKFLEPLPYPVLAGIVIKSLKGILMQALDVPSILKLSFLDGMVWLITFLSVTILNIEIGLGIALVLSLLSIILLNQNTYLCLLGKISDTELYLEIGRYPLAKPIPNFIITQIHGGLHFANIRLAISKIEKLAKEGLCFQGDSKHITLIMDMSRVTFTDREALHVLKNCILGFKRKGYNVVLTGLSGRVYEQMRKCDFMSLTDKEIFPSIQDAVSTFSFEDSK